MLQLHVLRGKEHLTSFQCVISGRAGGLEAGLWERT